MENGEKVIGMLRHVTIRLRYRSCECTPSWASDDEEGYTEVTEISEEMLDKAESPLTNNVFRQYLLAIIMLAICFILCTLRPLDNT